MPLTDEPMTAEPCSAQPAERRSPKLRTPLPLWCALVALFSWAFTGCSPDGADHSAPPGRSLRAGDSLFDDLAAIQVEDHPETSLPAAVRQELVSLFENPSWDIPSSAWVPIQAPSLGADLGEVLDIVAKSLPKLMDGETDAWQASFKFPPDLDVGQFELTHGGQVLSRAGDTEVLGQAAPKHMLWLDADDALLFTWEPDKNRAIAIGHNRPQAISCSYALGTSSAFSRLEWRLETPAAEPLDAEPLHCQVYLQGSYRPALLAPPPTSLVLPVEQLEAESFRVAVGVAEYGLNADQRGLRMSSGESDGVTFAVDIVREGAVERIWSRHVQVAEGFVEQTLDLSALRGESFELRLVTEPGPAQSATYDYGCWADLRLLGEQRSQPDMPHVVLIDIDTLRADRLGIYGYEQDTSPRIDAWARASASVYLDNTSTGNWTLPATVSMLTGLAPQQHQVLSISRVLADSHAPLARLLHDAGYETIGQTDGGYVVPSFGFAIGFDDFEVLPRRYEGMGSSSWSGLLHKLDRARNSAPVFAFVQTYLVHTPFKSDRRFDNTDHPYSGRYDRENISGKLLMHGVERGLPPNEADLRWINGQYDAAVRRMDDVVGGFLEGLAQAFGDDPYMVVLTSDHGEEIFEHGAYGHRRSLHDELLRVPLIVQHVGPSPPALVLEPTSILDIVPTILDAAGLSPSDKLTGLSLSGGLPSLRPRLAMHEQTEQALLYGNFKLIAPVTSLPPDDHSKASKLFNTLEDATEQTNLILRLPERSSQLSQIFSEILEKMPTLDNQVEADPLDEALIDDLKSLGYLGGG